MRAFSWKKTVIITTDAILAVYLVLAITAFNRPDELNNICTDVNINIEDGLAKGFLSANEVRSQLQRAKLYPLGDNIQQVNVRKIEEQLAKNPLVEQVQVYKTQTGHVNINLAQRVPVVRVKADNGDDYYVDEHGNILTPNVLYASDVVVATGNISKTYARKMLRRVGNFLLNNTLWRSQIEQIIVLQDGTMEVVPRVGDHVVYLGYPIRLEQKFSRLEKFYRYGLSKAGWNKYSYINLEFNNQIICQKRKFKKNDNQ